MDSEEDASIAVAPAVEARTFPTDLYESDIERWLTWKSTDDGRKIPRAPYVHRDQPDRYVSAQDAAVWTDFETAREWAVKLPGHRLALTIRDREAYPDEDLVLLDYDDARDPDSGALHPTVRDHLASAASYADVSPSGTGVHVLCRGALPDGTKTIADDLPADEAFPAATIEVYDSARYVAMSGRHLVPTPETARPAQGFLDRLTDEYATVVEGTPDALLTEPRTSRAALADLETTDDIQHVFDAIAQTTPDDIRLRSPVTEERSDGTKSRDPVWTTSDSGTRLAEVDDGWIYRDGMLGLDALQVVALEEGIVTDERTYPQGEAFWAAVEALQDRGAHVPAYESSTPSADATTTGGPGTDAGVDAEQPATDAGRDAAGRRATGETGSSTAVASTVDDSAVTDADADADAVAHALEVSLLRERVADREARIDALEAELADREARIDELEAHLADREARLASGTAERDRQGEQNDDPEAQTLDGDPERRPDPWHRLQRWLRER